MVLEGVKADLSETGAHSFGLLETGYCLFKIRIPDRKRKEEFTL